MNVRSSARVPKQKRKRNGKPPSKPAKNATCATPTECATKTAKHGAATTNQKQPQKPAQRPRRATNTPPVANQSRNTNQALRSDRSHHSDKRDNPRPRTRQHLPTIHIPIHGNPHVPPSKQTNRPTNVPRRRNNRQQAQVVANGLQKSNERNPTHDLRFSVHALNCLLGNSTPRRPITSPRISQNRRTTKRVLHPIRPGVCQ